MTWEFTEKDWEAARVQPEQHDAGFKAGDFVVLSFVDPNGGASGELQGVVWHALPKPGGKGHPPKHSFTPHPPHSGPPTRKQPPPLIGAWPNQPVEN